MNARLRLTPQERSPRAFSHFLTLVADANRRPIEVRADFNLTDATTTWDRLTCLEQRVFEIDPSLLNALVYAYLCYADMIGETDITFYEYREEDRAAFPDCFRGERVFSLDAAIGFMVEACGLPFSQATMWVCRAQTQLKRSGLFFDGSQDVPDGCLGAIASDNRYTSRDDWYELAEG